MIVIYLFSVVLLIIKHLIKMRFVRWNYNDLHVTISFWRFLIWEHNYLEFVQSKTKSHRRKQWKYTFEVCYKTQSGILFTIYGNIPGNIAAGIYPSIEEIFSLGKKKSIIWKKDFFK